MILDPFISLMVWIGLSGFLVVHEVLKWFPQWVNHCFCMVGLVDWILEPLWW